MGKQLTVIEGQTGIAQVDEGLRMAGAMADASAASEAFEDYKRRKAPATIRRQRAALDKFASFLDLAKVDTKARELYLSGDELSVALLARGAVVSEMQAVCNVAPGGATCGDVFEWLDLLDLIATLEKSRELSVHNDAHAIIAEIITGGFVDGLDSDPTAWAGVTWGLTKRFIEWLLSEGYSVGTVNVYLSTVKVYATLAGKAGVLDGQAVALIKTVEGYRRKEGVNIDTDRKSTRRTHPNGQTVKKAHAVLFSGVQADALMDQGTNTPRERRDGFLMTMMIEHGFRVSEVAILEVRHFDLSAGVVSFYRPKVDKHQKHELTKAALEAAKLYFEHDAPPIGPVFLASQSRGKSGTLGGNGISVQAIRARVGVLGKRVGIKKLSPHDLRHYAATRYAGMGYDVKRLMEIFGWNSPAMAIRYVADSAVVIVED